MKRIRLESGKTALVAMSEEALDVFKTVPVGDEALIKVIKNVNAKFHRKCMSLIGLLFDNQDNYENFDQFRYRILISLGFCETIIFDDGRVGYVPDSMAFARMDDPEREKVFTSILDAAIAGKLIGDLDTDQRRSILAEVMNYT